jgi:hypothetical protein
MGRSRVMTEQPQEPSDTMGGGEDRPCTRKTR